MRCIETRLDRVLYSHLIKINYNMRCIETVEIGTKTPSERTDKLQHEMY